MKNKPVIFALLGGLAVMAYFKYGKKTSSKKASETELTNVATKDLPKSVKIPKDVKHVDPIVRHTYPPIYPSKQLFIGENATPLVGDRPTTAIM